MDIKCKKTNCKHNNCCCCCANKIKVGKGVDCETFEKGNKTSQELKEMNTNNMFEVGSNSMENKTHNTKIACNAKCLFNNEGVCRANGIIVGDINSDAICCTQIIK